MTVQDTAERSNGTTAGNLDQPRTPSRCYAPGFWHILPLMTLSISISPEAEAKLKAKAEAAGVDVATYAARQLERMAASPPSLAEISGPVAKAFAESGMTEDQLADFLEEEKHAMRAERRAGQNR